MGNSSEEQSQRQVETHDYTIRGWGWDYYIREVHNGGLRIEAGGWGDGLHKGDYLLLQNKDSQSKPTTRYRIVDIEYYRDPSDMWSAVLEFAPRTEEELKDEAKRNSRTTTLSSGLDSYR